MKALRARLGGPAALLALVALLVALVAAAARGDAGRSEEFGLIAKYGEYGDGLGQLKTVYDFAIGPGGEIYVADGSHDRVVVYSAEGKYLRHFGTSGRGRGQFDLITGIAVWWDAAGREGPYVYVADNRRNCILKFRPDGTLVAEFGKAGCSANEWGSKPGELSQPSSLAVDTDGNVYVDDFDNGRIQKLGPGGGFLAKADDPEGAGRYGTVVDLAMDGGGGVLWATYSTAGTVGVLQLDANSLTVLKKTVLPQGSGNGQIADTIGGIAVAYNADTRGRTVHVVDPAGYRVQQFDGNLGYLGQWPAKGGDRFEEKPYGIALAGSRTHVLKGFSRHLLSIWGEKKPTTTTTTPSGDGDNEAPQVKALASKGKPGRITQLRYTISDDSGFAREEVWVYRGKKVIWKWRNDDFDEFEAGDVVFARWKVPATARGTLKFCVRAADEDGAQSPWGCSTVKIA